MAHARRRALEHIPAAHSVDWEIWRARTLFLVLVLAIAALAASQSLPLVGPLVLGGIALHLILGVPPVFRRGPGLVSAAGLIADLLVLVGLLFLGAFALPVVVALTVAPVGLLALRFGAASAVGALAALAALTLWLARDGAPALWALLPWAAAAAGVVAIASVGAARRGAAPVALPTAPGESGLEILTRLTQLLATHNTSRRVLEILLETTMRVIQPERSGDVQALALTFDPSDPNQVTVAAQLHSDPGFVGRQFPVRDTIFHEALSTGDAILTDSEQLPLDRLPLLRGHQIVLLPISTGLELYGLVLLAGRGDLGLDRPDDRRVELLLAVIGQCALGLQNAVLQEDLQRERAEALRDEEENRHQLARDFHDGPIQRVAAISMQLEFIKVLLERAPERVVGELESAQDLARQATQEMRTVLFALRPIVLESEGLGAALKQYAQRLRDQERLDIRVEAGEVPRLPSEVEDTIFAIVQEAAGNAKKYGKGAPIVVRLSAEDGFLIAEVEDKGPGFDVERTLSSYGTRGSLGMINMQERARLVDGRLSIDSAPGRGTTVSLAVPLRATR